ncbi:MAG TPA: NAD(P) transhydrogenase subunit alpha, partial [Tianweitania sediminis]|nr:NAD(P) transhydrogenase subunit alpha [Tianweitania sediminis]
MENTSVETALDQLDRAVANLRLTLDNADSVADAVHVASGGVVDPFVFRLAIFVLAIFVG